MSHVEIYTKQLCPYCVRAKRLLDEKGARFDEIDIGADPSRRPEMLARSGGRATVPQIFIDGIAIGGSDDLAALDRTGRLDRLLAG